MNADEIGRLHREAWNEASSQYGSPFLVPAEVANRIGEFTRARYVLLTEVDEPNKVTALKRYAVWQSVIDELQVDDTVEPLSFLNNAQKRKLAEQFWRDHVGGQITAKELAEAAHWSPSKATQFINDNVTIFFKVKKGLYEVRDPKVERERDKQRGVDG